MCGSTTYPITQKCGESGFSFILLSNTITPKILYVNNPKKSNK
jgi:hypothetical protein